MLSVLLTEILGVSNFDIQIIAHIDSNDLYQAVFSTKFVKDKRLRIDIAQIQEFIGKERVELKWIQGTEMLADILTKRGVNPEALLEVVKKGKLPQEKKEKVG